MRRSSFGLLLVAAALLGGVALADAPEPVAPAVTSPELSMPNASIAAPVRARESDPEPASSKSIGWPFRGVLMRGEKLEPSEHVRLSDVCVPGGNFFGTSELVGLVQRAAERVSLALPGAPLPVGELSARGGGRIDGHRSHRNGRDVDLGFYLHDGNGAPVAPDFFPNVQASGAGTWRGGPIQFDDARNWKLVEALLTDEHVSVQFVFVANTIRRRLLAEASRQGASADLIDRASKVIRPPGRTRNPHRNHFHVRVFCDGSDLPDCRDRAPQWPWVVVSGVRGLGGALAAN